MWLIKLILIILLIVPSVSYATTYFSTDFESGTLGSIFNFSWADTPSGTIALSTEQNHTTGGSRSMKQHYADTPGEDCNIAGEYYFSALTSFYSRQYVYMGNPVGTSTMAKLVRILGGHEYAEGIDRFIRAWGASGTTWTLAIAGNTPDSSVQDFGDDSIFSTNAWHCIEFYVQLNTNGTAMGNADGILRVWLDGTQVYENTTFYWRASPYTATVNALFWGYQLQDMSNSTSEDRYWDDIIVSDTYNGCGVSLPQISGCTISGASMQ